MEYISRIKSCYNLEEWLDGLLTARYVDQNIGRLQLTLRNPTDYFFDGVLVEVYFPGAVRALDPRDMTVPHPGPIRLPDRPRAFGSRRPSKGLLGFTAMPDPALIGIQGLVPTARPLSGLNIDNSASARITFPPVAVRANSAIVLDPVHLLVRQSEPIAGKWTATATNADHQVGGVLTVSVGASVDAGELLADVFAISRPQSH